MRIMLKILFISYGIIFLGNGIAYAAPRDTMACKVAQFLTPQVKGSNEFKIKNMKSRFTIIESEKTITAIKDSEDYGTSNTVYHLLDTSFLDIRGITADIIAIQSIVIESVKAQNRNHFKATITRTSSFGANVWMLECQKL